MKNTSASRIRTAFYMRTSATGTKGKSALEAQRHALQQWCRKLGYKLFRSYEDCGYYGNSPTRPGLQRLLKDATAGKFSYVLVHSLDRVCRCFRDMLFIIGQLQAQGIQLKSLRECCDTGTSEGTFMLGVVAAINEYERAKRYGQRPRR